MLQKQPININFSQGLDTKTDPFQIPIGKFSALVNSIFTKGGLLQKRNGFGPLAALPDSSSTYATTFNGDLTAIGSRLQAYSTATQSWVNKGAIQPVSLNTLPLIRNNLNQSQADSAVALNGLVCTAYTEVNAGTNVQKYVVADSATGQNIVAPTALPGADATYGTPRVFLLGNLFVIVYTVLVSAAYHLKYIAISVSAPSTVTSPADITTAYTPSAGVSFDGAVLNNSLYLAWNGAAASGITVAYLTSSLSLSSSTILDNAHVGTQFSVAADSFNQAVWVTYYNSADQSTRSLCMSPALAIIVSSASITTSTQLNNITSVAANGNLVVLMQAKGAYSYDSGIPTDRILRRVINTGGTLGSLTTSIRGCGLASKAFLINGVTFVLLAYSSPYQPTYFLAGVTGSSVSLVAKLAYENGGGYVSTALPSVTVTGTTANIAYLFKDLIQALSTTGASTQVTTGGIYAQTGINLGTFTIGTPIVTAEIGSNLNITGGFLWSYDGYSPVEQGFFLWPDSVEITTATGAGGITAQQYYYQATYEWSDNQGNIFRSAPSIPVSVTTTTATSTNTINVPTLRQTYKTANPVKIVLYRWSVANPIYYQVTSITSPILNDPTTDSIAITDALADSSIIGNNIIYTTGGVIEDTGAPASSAMTLFDDRLWLVDAEDPNLLWFSKQVIEATPVEMSDLLTFYVAPTIGSQGSTGPILALAAMDDKLILFKRDAIYYINGTGPDNTGANNQYSQPVFVTSSVGCDNQSSIVLSPQGLIFQSDKGLWLLGRDLSTQYIGAPVEAFNGISIQGSVGVPGTNQDRFTASNGIAQMFDYYYQQWGTFTNVRAQSSTLFQSAHTYISPNGQVFQETPGTYLDGTTPVLMSFTTGWINLAGLQGYQRAFALYLLGQYISPFKLICSIAYDYNSSPIQFATIQPDNFNPVYGGSESNGQNTVYGTDTPYGGKTTPLKWRIFLKQQRCEALQISIQEVYDPSFGVAAGQGFSLSGLQVIAAIKNSFRPSSAARSVGAK